MNAGMYSVVMEKEAAQTPDNENNSVTTPTPDLYHDTPPATDSVDASMGNKALNPDDPNQGINYSTAMLEAYRKGREELLNTIFGEKGKNDKAEQGLMSQHFDHVKSGDFSTSSPQLAPKMKVKIASAPPTLLDRIRNVTGRT